MPKAVTVTLDPELAKRIKKRLPRTDMGSVDEYVNYLVKEVLDNLEKEHDVYTPQQEKKVKARLRSLGYTD